MRFRDDDLTIIDRGAELHGPVGTESMHRAALHEAQTAILNGTVIRVAPDSYGALTQAISAPAAAPPPKAAERLRRSAPWERQAALSAVELLDDTHRLDAFHCGKPALNTWL